MSRAQHVSLLRKEGKPFPRATPFQWYLFLQLHKRLGEISLLDLIGLDQPRSVHLNKHSMLPVELSAQSEELQKRPIRIG
jgi:hypothetical protein